MNRGILLGMMLGIALTACNNNDVIDEKGPAQTIFIDNTDLKNVADVGPYVDRMELIPLKEQSGNLLAEATKVYVSRNHYLVFDRFGSRKIGLFDSSGNFVKTVLKTGEGPNDALQINDCWLNNEHNLEAYDFAQKKLYVFDSLFNLQRISKFSEFLMFNTMKSIPNSDKHIGYASFDHANDPDKGNYYHLAVFNDSLKLERTFHYYNKAFSGAQWLSYLEHFYLYQDTLRFVEPYNNYVYNVSAKGMTERYKIRYKEHSLPDGFADKEIAKYAEKLKDKTTFLPSSDIIKGYTLFNGHWLESNHSIFLSSVDEKNGMFYSLFDKQQGKIIYNARILADNGKYKTVIPPPNYYDADSNWFLCVIKCFDLKKMCPQESPLYAAMANAEDEDLFIFKVRFK